MNGAPDKTAAKATTGNRGYVTLYLDESGGKNFPPPDGNDRTTCYVQVGVALSPKRDEIARDGIDRIIRKNFKGQLGRPNELHYGDIINGRGLYRDWEDEQKKAIADDVFELIGEVHPILYGTIIQKKWLMAQYVRPDHPVELAMRATVDRFHQDLARQDFHAMVFMDEDRTENDAVLRHLIRTARRAGIKLAGREFTPNKDSNLDRILNTVVPFPSEMSPGLQLADFVAYATMSRFERNKDCRYRQIEHLWARGPGFREPNLFPTQKPANPWRDIPGV